MTKTYRTTIEVRGYELDSYGHVNNAVYITWLEHARWKMLEEEGITLKHFSTWNRWPVISSIEAKFLRPTFMGQRLDVETRVSAHRRVGFELEQKIFHEGTLVFEAQVGSVIVNEKSRPAEVPAEVERLWREHD